MSEQNPETHSFPPDEADENTNEAGLTDDADED